MKKTSKLKTVIEMKIQNYNGVCKHIFVKCALKIRALKIDNSNYFRIRN